MVASAALTKGAYDEDYGFAAGTAPDAFYQARMSPFRSYCRHLLLPFVKKETPIILAIQSTTRHPILDTLLKTAALTVTHTFNMLIIPFMYWFMPPELARGFTIICLQCTYWTGFIKDYLCLPRPLSPPIIRMANAKYHNHEYGFPSTHTTTAVAYVLYFYSYMARSDLSWSFPVKGLIYVGLALYAVLIAFGRVYCGMHSITDCVGGAAIGIAVWGIYTYFSETIAYRFTVGFWWTPLAVLAILVLSQVCFPVPIEDCPCSDDSAVCIPTTAGMVLGTVHFASMAYSSNVPEPGAIPYSPELGAVKSILRFVIGVVVVFTWRILAKKVAAWAVPPIYRVLSGGNDKQSVIMEERLHETSLSLEASLDQDYAVVSSLHMADDWIKGQAIRNRQQASSPLLSSSPLPESGTEVSSFESSETEVERDDQSFAKAKAATPSLSKTHQLPHGPLHHRGGLGPEYLTKMFVYTSLGYTLTCLVPVLFAVFGLSVPPTRV